MSGLARFGEPGLLVLLSLSSGSKHGYAITADILAETGVRLGPGTLYGSLSKLEGLGLIEAIQGDDRRHPYKITLEGTAALTEHLATWSTITRVGTARLGLA